MRSCLEAPAPWFGTAMYEQGTAMGRVVRRTVVTTDASLSGWGPLCDGRPAFGVWARDQKLWHINCLEMESVRLALPNFLLFERPPCFYLSGQHGGGQGGVRSCALQGLARLFLRQKRTPTVGRWPT
ncbi:hypothetical protein M9458_017293, partial [Cirrhinus mrigala]